MLKTISTQTAEQIERQWHGLTEWHQKQLSLARTLGKSLQVTLLEVGSEKIVYDVAVIL